MSVIRTHNHPAGLKPGWWEDTLTPLIKAMADVFNGMLKEGTTVQRYSAPTQLRLSVQLYTALNRCHQQAATYQAQAKEDYARAVTEVGRARALVIMARCEEDYNCLSRLICLASGGWTKALHEEILFQSRKRRDSTGAVEERIHDMSPGQMGWLKLSHELRHALNEQNLDTPEGRAVHRVLQGLLANHGVGAENTPLQS